MASIINSTTTSPGGLISTGDSSNSLLIQTGDTTAITVNSSQVVSLTNPLPVASGGTGANSNAAAPFALKGANSDITSITGLTTALSTGQGGTGTNSTTYCNLASNVTGTLPVANGGTGATTLTANNVLLGNGTSALQAVAPGTSGNVLTSNGTTWASTAPASSGISAQNCSYTGTLFETGGYLIYSADSSAFGSATIDLGSNRVMTGLRKSMGSNDERPLTFWLRGYNIKNTA